MVLCHVLYLPPLTRQALEYLAKVSEPGSTGNHILKPLPAAAFASPREELSAAASWAVERHRSGAGSTAIVLLDFHRDRQQLEYFLRQQFDCLGARYAALPVNFSVMPWPKRRYSGTRCWHCAWPAPGRQSGSPGSRCWRCCVLLS